MIPRPPTEADCEMWGEGAVIGPMLGRHVGAEDIMVIRHPDGRVRVPWVKDDRDEVFLISDPDGYDPFTVWTTFWGGMLPTDLVVMTP